MNIQAELGGWVSRSQRRHERQAVQLDAAIRELGTTGRPVTVHDLSPAGFSVDVDPPLPVGAFVWLRFRGTNGINARVVWSVGERHGCEFIAPISPALCETAMRQA